MGPEFVYEAILDHSDLGEIRWEIIEYPVGVVNRLHTSSSEDHAILENFSFGLEHDGNEADEWLDHEIESSPFEKFMNSHEDSLKLLHVEADKYAQPILYRMLHSQQITALEAYLGDTLINRINEDQKTLQSLLENDLDLGKLKFNLLEISSSNSFAKEKITHYLKSSVLYHNLERVEVLYKNSFGFSLLKDFPDQSKLFKIIHLRHDCVHRNGFNKDGVPIEITKKDLRQTYRIVKKFVLKVQDMVDKL